MNNIHQHFSEENKFVRAEKYLNHKYDFRRNKVSLEIELAEKGTGKYYSVNENSLFRKVQRTPHPISINSIVALLKSDFVREYDPFVEYFGNLQYDGQNHIDKLSNHVQAADMQEWQKHFKKHLVRTVACALENGYFNKQALILVHDKQNSGKSTFIRFLCPPALKNYIAEDISTDKDSRILIVKNFIINLDELDKLNKKDIASVKSFISKVQINERLPYDRKNTILSRRASFFGSTNNYELLDDPTGSVRWLCFDILNIDWSYINEVDIDQVWAEAYHLYKSDFVYNLSKEELELNEKRNKRFQVLSMELELIRKYFAPDLDKDKRNFMTATEVLIKLNQLTNVGQKLNKVQIGKALKTLGYPEGSETISRIKGYYLYEIK